MRRPLAALGALVALLAFAGTVAVAVLVGGGGRTAATWTAVASVLVVGLLIAAWKTALSVEDDADLAADPWAADGEVAPAPERTPETRELSGTNLAPVVERAGEAARAEGTVQDGLAVVRPELQTLLTGVLSHGQTSRAAATRAIENGTWTDDRIAAAVLHTQVESPPLSVRERLIAWLFPERAVRDHTGRAVGAIATAADEHLPPVVGQQAPRNVPVVTPTLEDLQRAADGQLQRAIDGIDVAAAPRADVPAGSATGEDSNGTEPTASDREGEIEAGQAPSWTATETGADGTDTERGDGTEGDDGESVDPGDETDDGDSQTALFGGRDQTTGTGDEPTEGVQ
jgi:hypothetical protein